MVVSKKPEFYNRFFIKCFLYDSKNELLIIIFFSYNFRIINISNIYQNFSVDAESTEEYLGR